MPSLIALFGGILLPYLVLRFLRTRRQKAFGAQFPDALDMIVRSLRAGHPTPIALTMVAREMRDPIGSEFGIVVDEITYGADLETALRNLYFRVGQDDLPLFVTAVAIQGSTGGNLGEILENLSGVIRRALQDAAQDPRAGGRRTGLRPYSVVAADRDVPDHPARRARFLRQRLGYPDDQACLDGGRHLDGDRQLDHVPARELQDLTDGAERLRYPDRAYSATVPP